MLKTTYWNISDFGISRNSQWVINKTFHASVCSGWISPKKCLPYSQPAYSMIENFFGRSQIVPFIWIQLMSASV